MKLTLLTKLCLDCDEIFNETTDCPKCAGRMSTPLSVWVWPWFGEDKTFKIYKGGPNGNTMAAS